MPGPASATALAPHLKVVPLKAATGKLTITGDYAQVAGSSALSKRINAALRAPIDARAKEYVANLEGHKAKAVVDSAVKLNGPRYASVRYDITIQSKLLSHPTWLRARTVTVDLRTGKALRGTDLFAPGASLRKLTKLFMSHECLSKVKLKKRSDLNGAGLQFALTGSKLEVTVDGPFFGTATACGQQTFKIPYGKLPLRKGIG